MTDTATEVVVVDRPRAPIEFRVAETLDVKYPDRLVTVLAMPYEVATHRVVKNGKLITEVCERGAFGKRMEHRKDVRVYRDHDKAQTAGRAVNLYPDRSEGLIAELRMSKTPLGDETLELAADRLLDASVGFAPIEERYSADRSTRHLVRCYLDHIALVADPAYETATVLDVRHAPKHTLIQRLAEGGTLDERGLRQLVEYLSALSPVDGEPDLEQRQAAEPSPEPTSTTPLKDQLLARLAGVRCVVTAEDIEMRYSQRPS